MSALNRYILAHLNIILYDYSQIRGKYFFIIVLILMILRLCFRSGRNFFDIKQIVCLSKYNHLQQFFVIKLLLSLHNVIKLHKIVHENTQNMNLPTTTLPVFLWRVLRETV